MTDMPQPAEMERRPRKPSPWRNLSVVWLVPVLALVVSLGIAWRTYADRGQLIEIEFQNAAGVKAGETTLHYRDVIIGTVENIGFTEDLEKVLVSARVDNNIVPFLNETAQFWVVRPEVTAQGVSGLSTVLSGVYIEGTWEKTGGPAPDRFQGLDQRPLVDVTDEGTRVTLTTQDGTVTSAGTPVFYRGVQVGRTEAPRLDESGSVVMVEAFVEAPHDRLLTTATRFWDNSGFSVSLGADGLTLDVGSFAALLSGGISFNTFFDGGRPVEAGHIYELYVDQDSAKTNAFSRVSGNTVTLATVFQGGVSGLTSPAEVRYEGLKIGEVRSVSAFVTGEGNDMEVSQQVLLEIDPELMGLPANSGLEDVLDLLSPAVEEGLRARLESANLLGSTLIVELAKVEGADPASLDRTADPYPVIPSVPSNVQDINATLEGVLKRVNGLRIEELIQQATSTLASIEAVATGSEIQTIPKAVVDLIEDARALVNSEAAKALPGEALDALADLRITIDRVNSDGVIAKLSSTLASADAAMANLSTASDELPALVADLREVAAEARDLPARELVESATEFLNGADALIDSEETRAIPPALTAALEQLRGLLAELQTGGAIENTNAALASARSATESLERATADLPSLTARLESLVARSEDLISAYGARSDFNSETLSMLREISAAARTVTSLARSLERSPNSLLFGK